MHCARSRLIIDSSIKLSNTETVFNVLRDGFKLPRPLMFNASAPAAVVDAARTTGARVRLARVRRRLTLRQLAAKAGVAYDTARAVEAGNLMTGLGAYLALIWALGLERELTTFLDPDRDQIGKQLELTRVPQRARAPKGARDGDF
jgi:transcriptional regulator with XRE-family HTH domain